ncbi:hypothetical protein Tco_0138327 [Tanacetum coccineum]
MEVITDEEEVEIDAIPLAVKSPTIVDWKIHKEGRKSYYQIIRADGNSQMYMIFSHMLKSFDREDLENLYKLVKPKYESTRPVEDLDLALWNDLKIMFEPHVEDNTWRNQQDYKVLNWKMYDSCVNKARGAKNIGSHSLESQLTPSDIQYSAATQIWGCYRLVSRAKVIENQTDSKPRRVFWGADEELSDGGSPRVIVLGYDGLLMQPPHDPDYVPEPMYPEYIPLEDEHVFSVEEQPLPLVVSPTAESPGYVVESDPEENPEEYADDEIEDAPVDYPMDGGEDGDDDDGDLSGADADYEDEDEGDEDDEDEEEEEEHLAPADSAVVVPTVEPVSLPEGTEPVIPPPSTDITTTGARITVRLQASISLPPDTEVERLLDMPTPPPSPPISLSPPSAGERLARCTTLKIASTQALIDAVTATLPSPPLPPLPPSVYIPPHVDRRDDIPESELPPRKRSYLFALGSRYEVGESSTARPIGEAVPEIAPMTVGEVNTRVTELAELYEHDTQDLYALLEDA